METIMTTITSVVTSIITVGGQVVTFVTGQPLLLIPVGIGFLGAGIGLYKRARG